MNGVDQIVQVAAGYDHTVGQRITALVVLVGRMYYVS